MEKMKLRGFPYLALLLTGFFILFGSSGLSGAKEIKQSVLQAEAKSVDPAIRPGHCPVLEKGLVEAKLLPPVREKGGCGHKEPYSLTRLKGKARVDLSVPAKLNCAMVSQLYRFFSESVQPLSVEMLGQSVVRIEVACSYSCRPRNNKKGAKMSEHSRMNAIDIGAFVLADGTILSVTKNWHGKDKKGEFLRRVNRRACQYFSTVIGPEGDSYHQTHFHLDLGKHGRNGLWRYCH